MGDFNYGVAVGWAIIVSVILIAVVVYTIVKLKKQVGRARKKQQEKESTHHADPDRKE